MAELIDPNSLGKNSCNAASGLTFSDLLSAINALFAIFVCLLEYIWYFLVEAANFIWAILQSVGSTLAYVLYDYVIPFFQKIVDFLLKIYDWVRGVLQPIINIIQRIVKWYDMYILRPLTIILEIIQRIRVALQLLVLLHVKWAQQLDADLQVIQAYITESIALVVGTLNSITTLLGIMVDPELLIRPAFYARTLFGNLGISSAASNPLALRPLTAGETATQQGDVGLMHPATPTVTAGADGKAVYSPAMQDVVDKLNAAVPIYNSTAQAA